MQLTRTPRGNYIPTHDEDVALFAHCCNGAYEVTEEQFTRFRRVFALHGIELWIKFEPLQEQTTNTGAGGGN